jgi:hypothetical protein
MFVIREILYAHSVYKIICKIRSPRAYVRTQNFAREVPKRIEILGLGLLDCKPYIFLNYTPRNVVEFSFSKENTVFIFQVKKINSHEECSMFLQSIRKCHHTIRRHVQQTYLQELVGLTTTRHVCDEVLFLEGTPLSIETIL